MQIKHIYFSYPKICIKFFSRPPFFGSTFSKTPLIPLKIFEDPPPQFFRGVHLNNALNARAISLYQSTSDMQFKVALFYANKAAL